MESGVQNEMAGDRPAEEKLTRLCAAIGLQARAAEVLDIFREMWTACGLRSAAEAPRWSGLTDDSTPTEYSIVFISHDSGRLRVLFEPQADPASPATYWEAGRRVTRWLGKRWGASLDHALEVEDIFIPQDPQMNICVGHAVEFDQQPSFKMYYNAMAAGPSNAIQLVDEAFRRLGYLRPWNTLRQVLGPGDRIELFALDLTPETRLKLYVRPIQADLDRIRRLYCASSTADPQDVGRMWDIVAGSRRPETSRPVFLTYQFSHPDDQRPSRTALSIPLFPGVRSDLGATRRIRRLLRAFEMPVDSYTACVRAMADLPLQQEEGIHSYVALQRNPHNVAIVPYFNPRLYFRRYGWLARDPACTWPTAVS
jgi:hypothetical protein